MSLEQTLFELLNPLAAGGAFPDVTPDAKQYPLIIYQQVGGSAGWYVEGTVPDKRNARVQVYVWSESRAEAVQVALSIEKTLSESGLIAAPLGAFTSLYEEEIKKYGTRQDFSIWHTR